MGRGAHREHAILARRVAHTLTQVRNHVKDTTLVRRGRNYSLEEMEFS